MIKNEDFLNSSLEVPKKVKFINFNTVQSKD